MQQNATKRFSRHIICISETGIVIQISKSNHQSSDTLWIMMEKNRGVPEQSEQN